MGYWNYVAKRIKEHDYSGFVMVCLCGITASGMVALGVAITYFMGVFFFAPFGAMFGFIFWIFGFLLVLDYWEYQDKFSIEGN